MDGDLHTDDITDTTNVIRVTNASYTEAGLCCKTPARPDGIGA
jgi:hypothetical protein